ncbi:MAG TPA: M23 family metallopeptidase [Gaiellaceae bacterium]|nr:M23 family metallopeptidase [Gaiellaceae bacterium]
MAGRQSILIAFIAVLALTGSTGAPSAATAGTPSAQAVGIQVSVPGQGGASAGTITGPPDAVGVGGSFAYPADGSIAQAASVSSTVSGSASATTSASASVEVSGLSLFGGEITAASITVRGSAKAGNGVSGDAKGSSADGVVVLGQPVGPGASVAYGSWGTVSVLQQSGAPFAASAGRGFETRVTGLAVHLSAEHRGVPAGTDILVGFIEVSAEPGAEPKPKPKPKLIPSTAPKQKANNKEKAGLRASLPPVRQIPFNVFPKLTAGGYVFPVYGAASYTNTFGAPRASTSWHHGEDIFAPLGAPILAVANGIVFSVGWNDIGGLRLWLQDLAGNEFYYAHLSAFSPLAVNGAQVRAGDVLGFMGNTGDAEATPYHLHFEIHPAALMYQGYDGVVAPYTYLNAWRRLEDLPLTGVSGWAPPISDSSNAPKPGAILLQARDISSATGLEPASLRRAMRASRSPASADGSFAGMVDQGDARLRALAAQTVGRP